MWQVFWVFAVLLVLIFTGLPVYLSLLLTSVLFMVGMDLPLNLVVIKMFGGVNSFSLMAIPFFIIAGNIMAKADITDKIIDLSDSLVGQFKGGLGHVNILASMFFGGIQGSGIADASAIGGMLIPAMEKQGYDKDYAVAVTAGSSMLSPIIPPSIAMILYSYYTEIPVSRLFLGGVLPGVLIALLQMGVNRYVYAKRKYNIPTKSFSLKKLIHSLYGSIGALLMPIIIIVGIVTGIVTATEAGVIAIAYGLLYGFVISKKLKIKDMPEILISSGHTTAIVMITIAAAAALSNVLVRMRFQNEVLNFVVNTIGSPISGTLFLMVVIFVLGMFLDPTVLIAMLAPTVLAIGNAFGFDAIHYGVVMVILMQVGAITPPVGSFLFVACGVANLPIDKAVKPLIPFIATVLIVVLLSFFIPPIVTLLPKLIV
ncbi:TRAP transporter large permease [Sphaerochaeta globosa]|uniref:TRAP dicarboxylate transporter, DctM subunit n=1 Tax=Sphaerochaeta globosa (strain ATCC BAA-1886 / DSM 22777 / Buddy) TaxID=158189 RepID=F0RX84_SPHGB|nr:TRAP transporter large permease [Sphaerochaeta globosa]ADY11934.1 TRAP dicarboxylate transporter, DctM subunit [Sphaerochaeta globosa str. Buddy]